MAKATGVKKGSKLNFYKFIETEEPKGKGSTFGATHSIIILHNKSDR